MPGKPFASAGTAAAPLSVKLTLSDIRPAIWRRLVVNRTMTLGTLHGAFKSR